MEKEKREVHQITLKMNNLNSYQFLRKKEVISMKKIEIEEDEKNNFNTQKYKDNYKKVEEYVCKIDPRVQEKYKKIDKKIEKEEGILSYKGGKNLKDIGETKTKIFYKSLETSIKEHADILLRPRVMCDDNYFSVYFNQFKEEINKKINREHELLSFFNEEYHQRLQQFNDFRESDIKHSKLYRFFRNALYRQVYLLFYNTARVISNVKIEYDLWRSDTWKHIWGFNSSGNVYYKYRSSWEYGVFKFNLFYVEFSFDLFHLLLKPLKRISKFGSLLSYGGGDYFKKNGLDASERQFWDMINISLVQISVGPVKINGLQFALFDPIFFVISLCLAKYLDLSDFHFSLGYMQTMFHYLSNYNEIIRDYDKAAPKIYKLKEILKKFNFVKPENYYRNYYSGFIYAFKSYLLKKSILFNIIETWKEPYHKHFHIGIVFYTFVRILQSAPECFKEIPVNGVKRKKTIHEIKIIDTHYDESCEYFPLDEDRSSFRGPCDMFFLSLALLVYSMIDSISIDLRWFIENESVRKYCVKLKREVCKFFQGNGRI